MYGLANDQVGDIFLKSLFHNIKSYVHKGYELGYERTLGLGRAHHRRRVRPWRECIISFVASNPVCIPH